jgi:hypothetical protein
MGFIEALQSLLSYRKFYSETDILNFVSKKARVPVDSLSVVSRPSESGGESVIQSWAVSGGSEALWEVTDDVRLKGVSVHDVRAGNRKAKSERTDLSRREKTPA